MQPVRSISVLMPTFQGVAFLDRALAALATQELEQPWDFRAVDSGSTDETLAILERHRAAFPVPFAIEHIDPVEFDHGDTRNRLAARSAGDLLVFLTQDAIPAGADWLAHLVANFADPEIGAAYCRNVPRPDAQRLTRVFSASDPGYRPDSEVVRPPDPETWAALSPEERRLLCNFNDVASAVRREVWERHPFPRTPFGEDVLMARALLEAGLAIAYDAQAAVEHSHDYDALETRARAEIDGRFNAEWLGRICVATPADVELLVQRTVAADRAALEREGLAGPELEVESGRALELRRAAFEGLRRGGQSAVRRPSTRPLERAHLSVLFVVHGFPPDTWAGTEVYTLGLAEALAERGHRVTILARAPAPSREGVGHEGPGDGVPDFDVREDRFRDLRVLRMVHRLEHGSLRESYDQPRAVEAFRAVLDRERPDVVHFQHLIHLSTGLVEAAQERGLPTVGHLHDYWSVCPRVQLVRPDGRVCPEGMGAGCFLCVHGRALSQVPRLRRLAERRPEVIAELAAGRHPRRAAAGPRWEGLADLLERPAVVGAAFAACDLLVSPSRFLRQLLVDTAGFDPHTTIFSDNGMRSDAVRALDKEPDPHGRLQIGFVGTLVWYKGIEVLLRAMNLLADERCVLRVHGDFRPDEDPDHAQLAAIPTAANVEFRGRFDNARLSEVHAGIDVLVVPSVWYENSPVTIHEAWMTRTPVVASRLGGMAEYVRHEVDGLLFESGDERALADALRRLARDSDLVRELGRGAPAVKSLAHDAADAEYRYRRLACVVRTPGPRLLVEKTGAQADRWEGPAEVQGADLLLLRPGAAAEFDLAAGAGPDREIALEVQAFGGETTVALGGRLLLAGVEIGRIEPRAAADTDAVWCHTFRATIPIAADAAGPGGVGARLRVEPRAGGRDVFMRILRVAVRERPAGELPFHDDAGSASSDHG